MKTYLQILLCSLVFTAALSGEDLGPHNINGQGCLSCHNTTNVDPTKVAASLRYEVSTAESFTTYGGGELTIGPGLTDEDPAFHSAACLACHDGSLAKAPMSGATMAHNHPVDLPYPVGTSGHWPGTLTARGISFTPSSFDAVYPRSLRFYVSGSIAYIECATCHDPHNHSTTSVTIQGQTSVKPTANFVRGWYDSTDPGSNSVSQFCRSCHFEMSDQSYGR